MDKRRPRLPPELWYAVYERDHRQCIVRQLDPDASPCTDRWGNPVHFRKPPASSWGTTPYDLTFAHIKRPPKYARVTAIEHAVMACWGHHVFGEMWITKAENLEKVRDHLERLYGPVHE